MKKERIRAVDSWRKGPGRYDTVFVKERPDVETISNGLLIARARLFFSFEFKGSRHECALVNDYVYCGSHVDFDTGMWMVKPIMRGPRRELRIIPLTQIYRAAHLLPVYGHQRKTAVSASSAQALDNFNIFYVSKFIDYHAFEATK